jgi:SAM-dependent methyltransferase
MNDQEFDEHYFERLERARSHWWTRGMQDVAVSLLGNRDIGDALDDGCGSGASVPLLHRLRARRIHAIDIAWPAVRAYRAMAPSASCAMASATRLPYGGESFDLVVSADVLQHLTAAHAAEALREIARILRSGGRALIRTNAAFGRSKVADRTDWRLYRPDVLAGEIGSAGLELERLTHANAAQGLWASLPRPRRRTKHDHDHNHDHGHDRAEEAAGHSLGIPDAAGPLADAVGARLMKLEARWLRRSGRTLPFGHTLVAVAVKPPRRSASAS